MSIPIIWSDLHPALDINETGIRLATNIDAVKSSIDNILRTTLGERVMNPGFGSFMSPQLFEKVSDERYQRFMDSVVESLNRWDNRVTVVSLEIHGDPDSNSMMVKMIFSLVGYEQIFDQTIHLTGVGL